MQSSPGPMKLGKASSSIGGVASDERSSTAGVTAEVLLPDEGRVFPLRSALRRLVARRE